MSICRKNGKDSDVYMYESGQGIECCRCELVQKNITFHSNAEAYEHLVQHVMSGDMVPGHALVRLLQESSRYSSPLIAVIVEGGVIREIVTNAPDLEYKVIDIEGVDEGDVPKWVRDITLLSTKNEIDKYCDPRT
jgi:hypothetical protein